MLSMTQILRVPVQNGISRLYKMLEVYHSGPELPIYFRSLETKANYSENLKVNDSGLKRFKIFMIFANDFRWGTCLKTM